MRALLVVLLWLTAVAHADVTLATADDAALYVSRVSGDTIKRVYKSTLPVEQVVVADVHTVWAVTRDHKVLRIVDGRVTEIGPFTPKDWNVSDPAFDHADAITLQVATSGEAWLVRCVAKGRPGCTEAWMRLDTDKPALMAEPNGPLVNSHAHLPAELAAAPKGYAAHLREHEGKWGRMMAVTCSGPDGGTLWSSATRTADHIAWVMAQPAILAIGAFDPMAPDPTEVFSDGSTPYRLSHSDGYIAFIADCRRTYSSVLLLPDGLWAGAMAKGLQIWRGAKVLGTIPGGPGVEAAGTVAPP